MLGLRLTESMQLSWGWLRALAGRRWRGMRWGAWAGKRRLRGGCGAAAVEMRGWVRVGGRAGSRIYLQLLLVPPGPRTPSLKLRLRRAFIRFLDQPTPAHSSTHTLSCPAAHPSGCHYELLWSLISKDSNEVENIFCLCSKTFLPLVCMHTFFLKSRPPLCISFESAT